MKVTGDFYFAGVECRHGFKDPTKVYYILGVMQGLDVLRLYIDEAQYRELLECVPYSPIKVELDYNPVAEKNQMRLERIL